ncbi:MAG: alpha-L-fucosidase [Chloroflexota bacterium]|nr:alpha-L-fucosidase [Chloroflexota bacterium]
MVDLRAMIPAWFDAARFGLFFHWGHSSQRGCELSWPMVGGNFALPHCADIPVADYQSMAATFNPERFDAREWARLSREAGAEYAILTAKHHDGYSMFHTQRSEFSVEHSPFERDIVGEWVDAFRGEGLRVGLYFSLIDWHHPDYPAFTDDYRPYNFARLPRPAPEQWRRYLAFMFGQVRELLTNYGRIDLIWFDGQWEHTPQEWRAAELATMIRELQPEIVINDRLPGGDYDTPEQFVPAQTPARPWEVCLTMNESWGYNPDDPDYKSSRRLVQTLCEIAGKGGRMLLNLGPRGDGTLPPEQLERLGAVKEWMQRNGDSIIGTMPGLEPWQFYGPTTRRGDTLYLHLLMRPYDAVTVRGVPIRRVTSVRALSSGAQLAFSVRCSVIDQLLNADPMGELTIQVLESAVDPLATVIVVEIASRGG